MANEGRPASNGSVAGPGYYVVGEFLSSFEGDAYEDTRGQTKIPLNVKVLVGDEAVSVRYNNGALAKAIVDGAQRGQLVTLRVYPRLVPVSERNKVAFLKIEGFIPRS